VLWVLLSFHIGVWYNGTRGNGKELLRRLRLREVPEYMDSMTLRNIETQGRCHPFYTIGNAFGGLDGDGNSEWVGHFLKSRSLIPAPFLGVLHRGIDCSTRKAIDITVLALIFGADNDAPFLAISEIELHDGIIPEPVLDKCCV
jgi:hypothetical protein